MGSSRRHACYWLQPPRVSEPDGAQHAPHAHGHVVTYNRIVLWLVTTAYTNIYLCVPLVPPPFCLDCAARMQGAHHAHLHAPHQGRAQLCVVPRLQLLCKLRPGEGRDSLARE